MAYERHHCFTATPDRLWDLMECLVILPVFDNAPKEIVGRSLSFGLLRLLATLTEAFVWEESTLVSFLSPC